MLKISELYVYPVKSLGGIAMNEALVTPTGFEHDRRWMLVDENCRFISQREVPQMALLQVAIQTDGLSIKHKINNASVIIPFGAAGPEVTVTIWDDTCLARYICPAKPGGTWIRAMHRRAPSPHFPTLIHSSSSARPRWMT